ncbi:DinB family protein [Paenibacillus allorhizosphaerae]|uniref:DinB family protein n=1 Tax=Paenibacillus allorhizosphaerae TaxID=2849866 RepID=UPI00361B6306
MERQSKKPINEGKWSVKEVIGHLFYWDKFILEKHAPFMNQGAVLISFPTMTNIIVRLFNTSVLNTTSSLIDEFVENRRQLIETMSGIDSDVKFTIGSGKRQFTVEKYLNIFIDHDNHHLKQIKERLS